MKVKFLEFWRDIEIYITPKLVYVIWIWRNIKSYIAPKLVYFI